MSPKKQQPDPFFMIFPWGKVAGMLFLVALGAMFVYRLSETGGADVSRACLLSMIVTMAAGMPGLYAVGKTWGRDIYKILMGVMLACVIRLLISGVGLVIITSFISVHRSWFVLFLGVYYLGFLVVEVWLALWILRHSEVKEWKQKIHGNLWDIVS